MAEDVVANSGSSQNIDRLELLIAVKLGKSLDNLKKINAALEKFDKTVKAIDTDKINLSIGGGSGGGSKSSGTALKQDAKSFSDITKSLKNINFAGFVSKLYFARNITKQLTNSLANAVQISVDYTETLNLWQVAMRENISLADKFITKMNRAYGISEETLMRNQALFKNMLSALGNLSEDTSYKISESITGMALDFASLYNVSIERSMTTFQSVLSGQVRPIRSIAGYDITENTITDLYKSLGGEKTMRQLSQLDKRLLRILATFQQMSKSGALGDMEKTIENTANQLRIMSETTKEITQWAGIILEQKLKPIIPYVNAALLVVRDIAKALAFDLGYKEYDGLTGLFEQSEMASEAVDELTGKLLSFDRFEVLKSSNGILGDISIDQTILDSISAYSTQLGESTYKARELADSWLQALGFQRDAETDLWNYSEGIGKLGEKAKDIAKSIAGIFGTILFFKSPLLFMIEYTGILAFKNEELRNSIISAYSSIDKAIMGAGEAMAEILIAVAPIVELVAKAIAGIVELLSQTGMLNSSIVLLLGSLLAIKALKTIETIIKLSTVFKTLIAKINLTTASCNSLLMKLTLITFALVSFGGTVAILSAFNGEAKKVASTVAILTGLVIAGAAAWAAYRAAQAGVAAPIAGAAIAAGIGIAVGGVYSLLGMPSEASSYSSNMSQPDMSRYLPTTQGTQSGDMGAISGSYTLPANAQFNVYLDGEKVGIGTAGSVQKELVRVGAIQ